MLLTYVYRSSELLLDKIEATCNFVLCFLAASIGSVSGSCSLVFALQVGVNFIQFPAWSANDDVYNILLRSFL